MTQEQIINYCLQKPGAYLDFPFGPDCAVIKVKAMDKARIFAQVFSLKGEPKVTLNCRPDSAEFYRTLYPGSVTRGWHCPPVQQPHFNTVSLDGTVPDEEIIRMIDHSYHVVIHKFPKYLQKALQESSVR